MTEEQTAKKQRPVSFGGLSKTCDPVRNEACQNLLREASHRVIREANIPANIWELCKRQQSKPQSADMPGYKAAWKPRTDCVQAVPELPAPSSCMGTTALSSHLCSQYR